MKTMIVVVVFSFVFPILFVDNSCAQTISDEATAILEFKQKELEYRETYDGLIRDIKIKEAWRDYLQKRDSVDEIRGLIRDKSQVDDLYTITQEINRLRQQYWQEVWEFDNRTFKMSDMDDDITYCRFDKVENALQSIITVYARKYPDANVIKDAGSQNSWVKGKLQNRKSELARAEQAAMEAVAEGKRCREFCVSWEVPFHLLQSEVLLKCRPQLISEMKQVSELSKRAEEGFRDFKVKRDDALRYGESCVRECTDLRGAMERINGLNPYPFNKCAEYMLRQESGPDAFVHLKKAIDLKYSDLAARTDKINQILSLTHTVILNCDWNTLGRMKQDALQALPEEKCIRNYPVFGNLRNSIHDLDRKREARVNELRPLASRMIKNLEFCEGYFKISPTNPNIPYGQPSWDENRVRLYNEERVALDFAVREAFTQGYANCLRDIIARANALPPRIQVTARPRRRFDRPVLAGRPLDHCMNFGRNCDRPTADEFCRRNGLQKAVEWNVAPAPYTNIFSGERCDPPAKCDAFTFIICE